MMDPQYPHQEFPASMSSPPSSPDLNQTSLYTPPTGNSYPPAPVLPPYENPSYISDPRRSTSTPAENPYFISQPPSFYAGYPPAYYYGVPPTSPSAQPAAQGFAIASLVLGIVSVASSLIFTIVSLLCGILGLIFGIVDKNKGKNSLSTAGIVLSSIGIAIVVIAWIFLLVLMMLLA